MPLAGMVLALNFQHHFKRLHAPQRTQSQECEAHYPFNVAFPFHLLARNYTLSRERRTFKFLFIDALRENNPWAMEGIYYSCTY